MASNSRSASRKAAKSATVCRFGGRVIRRCTPRLSARPTLTLDVGPREGDIRQGRHFRYAEERRHTVADLIDRYMADVIPRKPK